MSVCSPLRLLITSAVIWTLYDRLRIFYSFYIATIVKIISIGVAAIVKIISIGVALELKCIIVDHCDVGKVLKAITLASNLKNCII